MMRRAETRRQVLRGGGCAAAVAPAVLLWPSATHTVAILGAVSFWVTVLLATVASAVSAFCIIDPIREPKRDPYCFLGQWFIWLVTPLWWGLAAVSLSLEWLRPLDLLAVLLCAGMCRWGAGA